MASAMVDVRNDATQNLITAIHLANPSFSGLPMIPEVIIYFGGLILRGNRTIKVDVRVLATTNRRLEESVERKEFRQDLYFRLNVFPIHVPPLRDRKGDIPFLAQQFAKWMVPERYLIVAELPKTSVGKFDKKAMREQYAAALDYNLVKSE